MRVFEKCSQADDHKGPEWIEGGPRIEVQDEQGANQPPKKVSKIENSKNFQKFDFKDPLNFDGLLTEDERMIEETAKQYAQEKLLPRVTKAYKEEHFDIAIMKEMGDLGFLGCTIDDYDLPGVSSTAYGLINRQIENVDSGYRSALSV